MKDQTRLLMDDLGHEYVKTALLHAIEMRSALRAIIKVLGPEAPDCEGCSVEIKEALKVANSALKWKSPR